MDKPKMSFEEFSSLYAYKKENGSYTISYVRVSKKEMIIPSFVVHPDYQEPIPVRTISGFNLSQNDIVESVIVSEGIRFIETGAFKNCVNLKNIELPKKSLVSIGIAVFTNTAYYNNESNWEITSDYKALYVGNVLIEVRSNEDLFTICVKKNTRVISSSAFIPVRKNLYSVTLPTSVEIIDDYAFDGCHSLVSIINSSSIKRIGTEAFANTGLWEIDFLDNVKTIGTRAFSNCKAKGLYFEDKICSVNEANEPFKDTNINTIFFGAEKWSIPDEDFLYDLIDEKYEEQNNV